MLVGASPGVVAWETSPARTPGGRPAPPSAAPEETGRKGTAAVSTVAQRVDVVEDRHDRVECLMQQAAERSDRFEERRERDREEWDRRM